MDDNKRNRLDAILHRIECAKKKCNRIDTVKLVAVSKGFSEVAIQEFYRMGLRDFGENYIQEWENKRVKLPNDIIWHVIGHVQRNKTKWVAEHADWLHTLDRAVIAQRIEDQRPCDKLPLNVCIEINISESRQKSGILPNQLEDLIGVIGAFNKIRLRGLMCIPDAEDLTKIKEQMQKMQELFINLKKQYSGIDTLSMGMSGDLEWAIKYGATMVRVGTALFGRRQ